MNGRRCGKAHGAAHETLNPCPQIDVFALDFLRVLLADLMPLGVDMALAGILPIGVKACGSRSLYRPLLVTQDDSLRPRMPCSFSIEVLLPRI